jgi:DNA-binding beta-propeller fold protein YncE
MLAQVRIPGRIPSDRSDHGIAVSGGYVWTPALRDGIFRVDAATGTPSGIVAVAGGVRGAAMDGGDGAVWVVGHDNMLRRIDARTTETTAAALIPEMGLMPTGVDLAYGGSTVWVTVADADIRHLIGFDPVTLDRRYHYVMTAVGLVSDAYELAADRDRVVITETWPGGVTVVDGAAGLIVGQHRFATAGISVDGDRAWLLSPLDGQATMVWTRTGDLLVTAAVPKGVETMVPTAEGGVWAAIPHTGELVRLRFSWGGS